MMAAFDYDGLTIDNMSVDLSYEFASSAADLTVHAAVKDAAVVTLTAAFDYVWITGLIPGPTDPGGEPCPVALLSEAEIVIENRGLFERLEPMLTTQIGDLQAVPQMVMGVMMDGLTEGGARSPSAAETEFVNNVASEVGRFIAEKNRIVLSAAPEGGVWLNAELRESPGKAIAALNPMVSAAPLVSRTLIAPGELTAAISGRTATLDEAARLRVGGAAREAWKGVSQAAAAHAIETWTSGGLGARVAALYGVAQ
jgi:hypothetical protein